MGFELTGGFVGTAYAVHEGSMEGFDRIYGDGSSDRDFFESLEQRLPIVDNLLIIHGNIRVRFFYSFRTKDVFYC